MHQTLIDQQTLVEHLNDEDWIIVDCRFDLMDADAGFNAYLEAHIPGAVYADPGKDLSGSPLTDHGRHPMPGAEAMRAVFSRLGIEAGKQVVVYDQMGGAFCARLWWMLNYMGHQSVALLDGGWPAWESQGRDMTAGEEHNSPGNFQGEASRDRLVTVDQVPEIRRLIDSRDPDRYQGKIEPIDPAAGHIPGALNYFFKNNLDQRGMFLSPEQIKENLKSILDASSPTETVFYCGSGVTACHNIFAMVYAGLGFPRLYGGSWSEWSSDPSRPVATGSEP